MRSSLALPLLLLLSGCQLMPRTANVLDFGADPTGEKDSTDALVQAHATGRPVHYPNGTYRFNGAQLNLNGSVTFESPAGVIVRNDISPAPVLVFDDAGNLIGLQQNHLEQDEEELGKDAPIASGSLVPPPLSTAEPELRADLLAHWYNDFGCEYRRTKGRRAGWIGWYYWTWNFHDAKGDGYDPARHPLLGFYRGDDPVVLDWQSYWLREYGVKGVLLCQGFNSTKGLAGWEDPQDHNHWLWQLFHHTPNFRKLRYVMYGPTPWGKCTPETQRAVENAWYDLVDTIYRRFDHPYTIVRDGKRYPVVFLWAEQALRGVFDNYRGGAQLTAFYLRLGKRFQEAGYDGVALFARQNSRHALDLDALERGGVLHFLAEYASVQGKGKTYPEAIANHAPPTDPRTILSVMTAKHTHTPHPSKWDCPGHSPAQFRLLLQKTVDHLDRTGMPRIITCYNVAEWAEGGPGLQPNVLDRFGYLEAVRDALVVPRP